MRGFLKCGDIAGESLANEYRHWSNLISVRSSITRPMAAGASGSTRHRSSAVFGDIVCIKEVDSATIKLQEAIADGINFPKVCIAACTSSEGGHIIPYMEWELKNARVVSYTVSGTEGEATVPMEEISFNFEEIKVVYHKLGMDNKLMGKLEYTWKVEEGVR